MFKSKSNIVFALLFLLTVCEASFANSDPTTLFVKRSAAEDEVTISKFGIPSGSVFLKYFDVWISPKEIDCKVRVNKTVGEPSITGAFDCLTPDGYSTQTVFDCSINNSEESSMYFFIALRGFVGNVANFYVWCE